MFVDLLRGCLRLFSFSRRISWKRWRFLRYLSFSVLGLRLLMSPSAFPKDFSLLRSLKRWGYLRSMKCLFINSRYASVLSFTLSSVYSLISPLNTRRSDSLKKSLRYGWRRACSAEKRFELLKRSKLSSKSIQFSSTPTPNSYFGLFCLVLPHCLRIPAAP